MEPIGAIRDVLEACAGGSASACETFFELIRPLLRRISQRIAAQYGAPNDVEDVVQEICLKIATSKQKLEDSVPRSEPAARAYMAVLAANAARDWFRGRGRQRRVVSLDDGLTPLLLVLGVEPDTDKLVLMDQIEALASGSVREQTIFRLYYRQGLSAQEIATIPAIGLSVKGVESLILRIAKQVKGKMSVVKGSPSQRSS